ncbi:pyridoxal phosphate-dependent transferase [Coprinopsis sp. MPI-PUGE-AT-0042]|nr:pyridoxal phosphate-dependent transferase [Coprinopsis sp. MPI-PUGE-AT-0042]
MSETVSTVATPSLSRFGDARLDFGRKMQKLQPLFGNTYSKENPEGTVNFAVAENSLIWDELIEIFERNFKMRHIDFTYGDSFQGSVRLRHALSSLFNSEYFNARVPVQADDLIIGSGLLSVISQLFRALVDPGNGILLAQPYYYAFDIALDAQTGVTPVGVQVPREDMFTERELDHFEKALEAFNQSKRSNLGSSGTPAKIQAIILCNPQNPYGRCYPPSVIQAYAAFAEKHNIHLISDEIYALSTFASSDIPNPEPFASILATNLDEVQLPDSDVKEDSQPAISVNPQRIHMIYGMSKDFDSNGLRVGVLHTRNEQLKAAMIATNLFMLVGSPSAGLWWSILQDKVVLDKYIASNRQALKDSYEHMTAWLKFHGVPYHPSQAGHFVMVNFRPFLDDESLSLRLPESTSKMNGVTLVNGSTPNGAPASLANVVGITPETSFAEREELLSNYWAESGVLVAKGTAYRMPEPGWYRITFCVKRATVDVGLRRLERAMGWKKWDGLGVE